MIMPIRQLLRLCCVCLICLWLAPQSFARKVKAVAAPHANFTSYKTYQWLPVKTLGKTGLVEDDAIIAPVIRQAVNLQLAALGMAEVKVGGDLEISAFATTTHVPQLEAVIFPGDMWMDFETPIATMGRYNKEGTLAINLIDTRTKRSAWVGMATDSLDNKPGSGAKKIPGATAALFSKYPKLKK